ncbi:hypothetical protein PYCC9005_000326 [Savitreella phatthalungensis]
MSGKQELLLDSSLRDWVLLPILFVMMLVGVARAYMGELLASDGPSKKLTLLESREQGALARAAVLRTAGQHIPRKAFEEKRKYLIDAFVADKYLADPEAKGQAPPNPLTDPNGMDGMMNMLKGNMANMVPQMGLMAWTNYFFSGFILLQLPFPLTLRFKQMLQSGVATRDLDVAWVSSLSWYFLNLFGLQFFYSLVLGDAAGNAAELAAGMAGMPQMSGGPLAPGSDPSKLFAAEAENLEVAACTHLHEGVVDRFLQR